MPRHLSEDGSIWWERQRPDVPFEIKIGFTKPYMENVLQECWHILPVTGRVKKGDTLLSIETNNGMEKIKSPFTGTITEFSDDARNFPERLNENTAFIFFLENQAEEKVTWPPPIKNKKILVRAPGEVGGRRLADVARAIMPQPIVPGDPGIIRMDEQRMREWQDILNAHQDRHGALPPDPNGDMPLRADGLLDPDF